MALENALDPVKLFSEEDINPWRPVCIVSLIMRGTGYPYGTAIWGYRGYEERWEWLYGHQTFGVDLSEIEHEDWSDYQGHFQPGRWAYIPLKEKIK